MAHDEPKVAKDPAQRPSDFARGAPWPILRTGAGNFGDRIVVELPGGERLLMFSVADALTFAQELKKAIEVQTLKNQQRDAERDAQQAVRLDYEARIREVESK